MSSRRIAFGCLLTGGIAQAYVTHECPAYFAPLFAAGLLISVGGALYGASQAIERSRRRYEAALEEYHEQLTALLNKCGTENRDEDALGYPN